MHERNRKKMIQQINAITGRSDCGEAVLMIQRPAWSLPVAGVIGVVLFVLLGMTDMPAILAGAVAGGVLGLIVAVTGTNRILGYCDGTVVMAASSTMSIKATEVVASWPYPVAAEVKSGALMVNVTVAGETYQMAKPLEDRFRAICGVARPAA
ncbi:MAG: hypothetical protein AAF567_25175 [Actinomycetota bacterium]